MTLAIWYKYFYFQFCSGDDIQTLNVRSILISCFFKKLLANIILVDKLEKNKLKFAYAEIKHIAPKFEFDNSFKTDQFM